jgi:hypothetical protein
MTEIEQWTILGDKFMAGRRSLIDRCCEAVEEQLTGDSVSRGQDAIDVAFSAGKVLGCRTAT